MLSKKQIKFIINLSQKKHRQLTQTFVAEGPKSVMDLVSAGLELIGCYTMYPIDELPTHLQILVSAQELKTISSLTTPQNLIGLFKMPKTKEIKPKGAFLALDGVRDPGNFGTIVRLCDWFGVKQIVCSIDSVDCYHPKVVQATMGSIARVHVSYTDLPQWLGESNLPKMGTFMDAPSVYDFHWPEDVILVMGNEGQGISSEVEAQLDGRLSIPKSDSPSGVESLNVATATSIALSEYFRTTIGK